MKGIRRVWAEKTVRTLEALTVAETRVWTA
jgi:hypothetical protein